MKLAAIFAVKKMADGNRSNTTGHAHALYKVNAEMKQLNTKNVIANRIVKNAVSQ